MGASKALDRILSYLLATSSFKIEGIFGSKENKLLSYTDSDHAGDMPMTTFSHTGVVIQLNNVPIKWKSTKQTKTSRSSAEAEVYALDCGVGESLHINNKLIEMNNNTIWPINIYVDNKQADFFFSKNITTTSKMRTTFNLKDARIRELRDDKKVKVGYVKADVNPSDLLTKIHSN